MKSIFYFWILLNVLIFACSSGIVKEDRITRIFSNYIYKEFNIKIIDSLHYYILIPRFGCKGCFKQSFADLNKIIKENNKKDFTIITTNPEIISDELKSRMKIWIDTSGKLDVLNLEIANLTLVETQNKKVNFLKSISTLNGDNLASLIKIH